MTEEENIKTELATKFSFMADKIRVQRVRRLFASVPQDKFAEVFDYLYNKMRFVILCAITGMDEGATLGAMYHLSREDGIALSLSVSVPKESHTLQTVTGYFPAAEIYERELVDLLGMHVQGLPEGPRYPLPDGWPAGQFPLRKDWKPEGLPGSEKEGEAQNA